MTKRNRAPIGSLQHDFGHRSPTTSMSPNVDERRRFTKENPRPTCGGHRDLPRKQGIRCYGFLSADGDWAHCSREQYANGLQRNDNSDTYAHRLRDECLCGASHAADSLQQATTRASSTPNAVYRYEDENGELLFEVRRSEGKRFLVFRPTSSGYAPKLGDARRVLYRLPKIKAAIAKSETVFIVEGEKDVDTLASLGLAATCNPLAEKHGLVPTTREDYPVIRAYGARSRLDNESP